MLTIYPLIYFIVFFFGLSAGSFLNSVIYRLHTGDPLLGEKRRLARSYCPNCRHKLAVQDLIPVLSFVMLAGRCRYCQKPISLQYPLVELATGALFAFALWYSFPVVPAFNNYLYLASKLVPLFYYFSIISVLIVIFVYDLRHYLIPDKIILPAIVLSLLYLLFEVGMAKWHSRFETWNFGEGSFVFFTNPLFSALLASAFFLAIVLLSKEKWMGMGDVKLAFLMGLALGFPKIAVAIFIAFMAGALIGVFLVLAKKKGLKSALPFGPFLVTGTILALFWGQQIIDWYWNTLFKLV